MTFSFMSAVSEEGGRVFIPGVLAISREEKMPLQWMRSMAGCLFVERGCSLWEEVKFVDGGGMAA